MAVLSDLVKTIAAVEGLEETQVAWVARHLREAGLITQGGRGRGGAQMATVDAANLLIGLNAASAAKEAAAAVSELKRSGCADHSYGIPAELIEESQLFRALSMPASPSACIEDLIDCFRQDNTTAPFLNEENTPRIAISFSRPILRMEVRVEEHQRDDTESVPDLIALIGWEAERQPSTCGDRSDTTTITERTLGAVARVLDNY